MSKKQMLAAFLMLGVMASPCIHGAGDGDQGAADTRVQGRGGNIPQWSTDFFTVLDTVCGWGNVPLDTVLQLGVKSKFLVTGFLGYLAYCAKDTVVEHAQAAPELISQNASKLSENASQLISRFVRKKKSKEVQAPEVIQIARNDAHEVQNDTNCSAESVEMAEVAQETVRKFVKDFAAEDDDQ